MKNKPECAAQSNDQSVLAIQVKLRKESIRRNRARVHKIASTLFFARQAIATRGHDESEM